MIRRLRSLTARFTITQRINTPLRLQLEARECGAVALGIVLAYYGRYVPLADLRVRCQTSRDGVRVDGIVRAARSYGLTVHAYKRHDIHSLSLPFIIFWNFNHFLVVEEFRAEQILVNDPAMGRRVIFPEDFRRYYSGIALSLEPNSEFQPGGSPPRAVVSLVSQPASLLLLVLELLLLIPDAVLALAVGKSLAAVVAGSGVEVAALSSIAVAGLVRIVLMLAKGVFAVHFKTEPQTQGVFKHLLNLPAPFFAEHYDLETSQRVTLPGELTSLVTSLTLGIGRVLRATLYLALLLLIDWPLALAIALLSALNVGILLSKFRQEELVRQVSEIDHQKYLTSVSRGLSDLEALHVNNTEDMFFQTAMHRQAIALNKRQDYDRLMPVALVESLPFANLVFLSLMVAAQGALADTLTGMILGLIFILPTLPTFVQFATLLKELRQTVEKLADVMQVPGRAAAPIEQIEGIDLQHIRYGYGATTALDGINLSVSPGQCIAIVGRSGCGKSTLLRLIAGLYTPWGGVLKVNRERLILVDGDPFFFDGTLRENLGEPDSSFEQVKQACQDALIDSEIMTMPDQYAYRFRDGQSHFSLGQLQRLEIARALARNPLILLLDEATSMIDTQTEKHILDNIIQRGCTCLIVSHRLSTIRDCEMVIVLDSGRIIQQGPLAAFEHTESPFTDLLNAGVIL